MPETSDASPIRARKHPFRKVIGLDAQAIYRRWTNPADGLGLSQSAPDFAVREPCPHSILFEGKYFSEGGYEQAASELVKALYEAFFYRGLPSRRTLISSSYGRLARSACQPAAAAGRVQCSRGLASKRRRSYWGPCGTTWLRCPGSSIFTRSGISPPRAMTTSGGSSRSGSILES